MTAPIVWPVVTATTAHMPVSVREAWRGEAPVAPRLYFREEFPPLRGRLPPDGEAPELRLERFEGVTLGPNQLIFRESPRELLDVSFNRLGEWRHPRTERVPGGVYPKLPSLYDTGRSVEGPLYLADTPFPKIHGHLLVEVLPKLWAYGDVAGMTVATSVPASRTRKVLMDALGVDDDAILTLTESIRPGEVYLPTPPVMLMDYVHPAAQDVFARLARLAERSDAGRPERLYVSRSKVGRRPLANETEVEAVFESLGFTIYHPQDHPIEDQIRTFSDARLVAGSGGSALHNAVFSTKLERLLILSSPDWFTAIDLMLHPEPGKVALLFGMTTEPEADAWDRSWRIDLHQLRLTLAFFMDV